MKKLVVLALLFTSIFRLYAKEGMWIPMLIKSLNEADMQSLGFKLTAEDVYSFNKSSLKDGVVHFGGGCTSELISGEGLLLTNHHCGYGRIQAHSSVENNYLKDGFWAMSKKEELPNRGLTATLIVRMEDVTDQVLEGTSENMPVLSKRKMIAGNIQKVGKAAVKGTHYGFIIRPFYYGNKYYMFLTETFRDIRLVGAPPSSIGKFGFDTDNWVWPRHTGDFSLFRIYAGKDNKPADYSEDNVPYKPKHFFPINTGGLNEGDFTMVYGFPGRTQEYLTSHAVEYIMTKQDPGRVKMRDASLSVINAAMAGSEQLNIQYAAKQSRISNAWKKWKGELKGLRRLDAINKKKALEARFQSAVDSKEEFEKYRGILGAFDETYAQMRPYEFSRDYFIEIFYYGPEVIRFADGFNKLLLMIDEKKGDSLINPEIEKLRKRNAGFFKNYNVEVDKKMMKKMLPIYFSEMDASQVPSVKKEIDENFGGDVNKYVDNLFKKSILTNKVAADAFLAKPKTAKLKKDPAFKLCLSLVHKYFDDVKPTHSMLAAKLDSLYSVYMPALMEVLPNERVYFPDANSTLRISYGKVEGYIGADAVEYKHYTTLSGVVEKYVEDDYEFDLPDKLIELYRKKDYGRYARDGEMRVCFLASNHTTGGNSGSPALDANGNLIGLNFDRVWEGTMSDVMFDPEKCRNIMVDVNYVLFIIDKFAGAGHLIDEMTLID